MNFENLSELGKKIKEFFTNIFSEDDYFLFSITPNIFKECIKSAKLSEDAVYKELKNINAYFCNNEFVRISIAAFQVKTLFESNDSNQNSFLQSLIDFYDDNNIYNSYLSNQNTIWETGNIARSVLTSFKNEGLSLMIQNSRGIYGNYKYLKYPENQLFFLTNNLYKFELLKVCVRFDFKIDSSIENIIERLKSNFNWDCYYFKNFLKFDNLISENFVRIIAFSIYVYLQSSSFKQDLFYANNNGEFSIDKTAYDFEISKYNENWFLNIYCKNQYQAELSENDAEAFNCLCHEILAVKNDGQLFIDCGDSEYESNEYYRPFFDYEFDNDNRKVIFVSSKDYPNFFKFLVCENFLSNRLKIYKFNSLSEYYSLLPKDSEAYKRNCSLISMFKGGVRIKNRHSWLKGCAPKIPEGMDLNLDEAGIYHVNFKNRHETIEIIDTKKNNAIVPSEIGWKIFGLPDVNGFYVLLTEKISKSSKFHYREFNGKRSAKGRGFYDGEKLVIEEIQNGINWQSLDSEFNYLIDKSFVSSCSIIFSEKMEIGFKYEFNLYWFKNRMSIYVDNISCIKKSFKSVISKGSSLVYKKFERNTNIQLNGLRRISNNENFYTDYTEEEISANAIGFGTYCFTFDFDNSDNEAQKASLCKYIEIANKNSDKLYFIVLKGSVSLSDLNGEFSNISKDNKNVVIFLLPQEKKEPVVYVISDSDFSHKQEQIKIWLKYVGFAQWHEINRKCQGLLEGESEEVRNQYGNNPIYRLFYPLVVNGDVEVCSKIEESTYIDFGETHKSLKKTLGFCIKENISDATGEQSAKKALDILKNFPSICSFIKSNWFCYSKEWGYPEHIYIRNMFGNLSEKRKFENISSDGAVVFKMKQNRSPHLHTYITIKDDDVMEIYEVDEKQFDSMSYANCLNVASKGALFRYSSKNKVLECVDRTFYSIIPILIQRALQMFDIENLNYLPYRNYDSFKNISESAVEQLKRIFGEKSVEEI